MGVRPVSALEVDPEASINALDDRAPRVLTDLIEELDPSLAMSREMFL